MLIFDLNRAMGSGFNCNLDITIKLLTTYLRGIVELS